VDKRRAEAERVVKAASVEGSAYGRLTGLAKGLVDTGEGPPGARPWLRPCWTADGGARDEAYPAGTCFLWVIWGP
jgi:hypothetical protein